MFSRKALPEALRAVPSSWKVSEQTNPESLSRCGQDDPLERARSTLSSVPHLWAGSKVPNTHTWSSQPHRDPRPCKQDGGPESQAQGVLGQALRAQKQPQ